MENPSIALIPSAYNDSIVFSMLPENGAADLDFTRPSIATVTNEDGLIEIVTAGVPRLVNVTDDNCPSILLENASENLAKYSEDFSNAVWVNTNSTLASNSHISPDGTLNADTLTATANDGQSQQVHTGTSGVEYTVSFWLKRKTGTGVVNLRVSEDTNIPITITNEWVRYHASVTSTTTTIRIGINLSTSGDEVYIHGAQLELGALTSYIPTEATAVSRDIERAYKLSGLTSHINSVQGTIYVEMQALVDDATDRFISISDASGSNIIYFGYQSTTGTMFFASGGATTPIALYSVAITQTNMNKIALRFKENDCAIFINGVKVAEDLAFSGFAADTFDRVRFDGGYDGKYMFAYVKDFRIYKTGLSDAHMAELSKKKV